MRKLVVLLTGQVRSFWETWENMVMNVMEPARRDGFCVILGVCLDKTTKNRHVVWRDDDERAKFIDDMTTRWEQWNGYKGRMYHCWVDRDDVLFHEARDSLLRYLRRGMLSEFWYQYLVNRSGSCIEYVQFVRIYETVMKNEAFSADDLLMRARTDILLRHPLSFSFLNPTVMLWDSHTCIDIMKKFVPDADWTSFFREETSREGSIYPVKNLSPRWIITFRKNLIYIMPVLEGIILFNVIKHYGDWDTVEENLYWFNAESQFRGCLRHHSFLVLDFSQQCDECFDRGFIDKSDTLPIYTIQR